MSFRTLSRRLRAPALLAPILGCMALLGVFPACALGESALEEDAEESVGDVGDDTGGDVADDTGDDGSDRELVTTALPGVVFEPTAIAVQPGGEILIAAGVGGSSGSQDFLLLRYLADGTLDPDFGQGGMVVTDFFGAEDQAFAIALQDDGAILVTGYAFDLRTAGSDFALARYTPDGALDASFGAGGKVTTDFGSFDTAEAIAVQDDGAIVIAGSRFDWYTSYDMAAARYTADGALDASFADQGRLVLDLAGESDSASGLVLREDGPEAGPEAGIILAGRSYRGGASDFAVVGLTRNGALDAGFGEGGVARIDFSAEDAALDIATLANGDLVVAGHALGAGHDFALARLDGQGRPVDSFGDHGRVQSDFGDSEDRAFDVTVQPDGRIMLIGSRRGDSHDVALARYRHDGSLDPSLGKDGLLVLDLAGGADRAWDAAVQPDGRLAVSGAVSSSAGGHPDRVAVARYRVVTGRPD
jgi:uncharacterized delta-60 repeat protein